MVWDLILNVDEIEPAYRKGRHDATYTQRDDYQFEILPKVGTSYPEKPGQVPKGAGQVMTIEKTISNR